MVVEHANGDRTLYGHNSLIRVKAGDMVEQGMVVAFSGNSGRSTGPHVHFERIASGRPIIEEAEGDVAATVPLVAINTDRRSSLEQQMDESVNSILRKIRATNGEGG
ncbi:M23 family metallopeptidase [Geotalea sp. SG265]|uniref:M23 family metallopeptidase n=1 Tax=Geotalea sp. SG265 TaxID=2922867 RepID=UPI00325FBA18